MPPQGRVSDLAQVPADAHGCPACPHPAVGPAVSGSADVLTNGLPSLRVGDAGVHAACCGPNKWNAKTGSATVLINGRKAHRLSDMTKHCGGIGQLIMGSPNVIVGDSGGGGSGAGANTESTTQSAPASAPAAAPPPAPPASQPPPSAPAAPPGPPKQAPAKWNLVHEDGTPVQGYRTRLSRAKEKDEQDLHPDGQGRNELQAMDEDEAFAVMPVGTKVASGAVKDADGKPVAGAKVDVVRAFGPPITVVTNGGGTFEAKGLLSDEPFEIVVHPPDPDAKGRFTDEKGQPVPVRAAVWLDRRRVVDLPVAEDGTYTLRDRPTGDAYDVLFVASLLTAKGRFVDEVGLPVSGLHLRARLSSGRAVEVLTQADGTFRIPGVMPEETYSLEILSPAPR